MLVGKRCDARKSRRARLSINPRKNVCVLNHWTARLRTLRDFRSPSENIQKHVQEECHPFEAFVFYSIITISSSYPRHVMWKRRTARSKKYGLGRVLNIYLYASMGIIYLHAFLLVLSSTSQGHDHALLYPSLSEAEPR